LIFFLAKTSRSFSATTFISRRSGSAAPAAPGHNSTSKATDGVVRIIDRENANMENPPDGLEVVRYDELHPEQARPHRERKTDRERMEKIPEKAQVSKKIRA
jgi:hypothetical protein